MYLLIDNSAEGEAVFYLSERPSGRWKKFSFAVSDKSVLLVLLDKVLKQAGKKLTDLRGLVVRVGLGRFTATRVAVTVANAMAFCLKIPVISATDLNWKKIETALKKAKAGVYVSAKYSGEANIGKKLKIKN